MSGDLDELKRLEEAVGLLLAKREAADSRLYEAQEEAERLDWECNEAREAVKAKKKEIGISEARIAGPGEGNSLDPATAGLRRVVRRKGPAGC